MNYRDHDRQTTENSKTAERRRRKARRLKPVALVKTDRLTETQNQGNLMTQSHGSNVVSIVCDYDRQTAEERIFFQG